MGKLLNVQYIITGRMTKPAGDAYQLNVQMIEVQTAQITTSETLRFRGDILGFLDRIGELVGKMMASQNSSSAPVVQAAPAAPPPVPSPAPPSAPPPAPSPAPQAAAGSLPVQTMYGNPISAGYGNPISIEASVGSFDRGMDLIYTEEDKDGPYFTENSSDTFFLERSGVYFGFPTSRGYLRLGGVGYRLEASQGQTAFGTLFKIEDHIFNGGGFAVDYRHLIGVAKTGVQQVFFVGGAAGGVFNDLWSGTLGEFYAGYGVAKSLSGALTLYGSGVISSIAGSVVMAPEYLDKLNKMYSGFDTQVIRYEYSPSSSVGLVGGVSLHLGPVLTVGLELHGGHQSGATVNLTLSL